MAGLFGVACAFFADEAPIVKKGTQGEEMPGVYARQMSGLGVVIPADRLKTFLQGTDLEKEQDEAIERGMDGHTGMPTAIPASGKVAPDEALLTREGFMDALEKVSRPDEPQPDEASE